MPSISLSERTVIELGLERTVGTATTNLIQIPIYNVPNPLTPEMEFIPLRRMKGTLDPEAPAIGIESYALQGEFFVYGDGIANLPPDWVYLMMASGYKESRWSSKTAVATTGITITPSNGAGALTASSSYDYKFTMLVQSDGTTRATTRDDAAYETIPSALVVGDTGAGEDTNTIAFATANWGGSSRVIKRLYRTEAGGTNYYFVAEVDADTLSYTDLFADSSLDRKILYDLNEQAATHTATPVAGTNLPAGDYNYKYTSLYKADGSVATDSKDAVFESAASDAVEATTATTNLAVDIAVLPSSGVKRLYRTLINATDVYYFLTEVADGTTTYSDNSITGAIIADRDVLVNAVDLAVYTPVSDYDDFDALTMRTYLDDAKAYPASGCRGTINWSGQASNFFLGTFQMRGTYSDPTADTQPATISSPGTPPQMCGIGLVLTREGDPDNPITPVVDTVSISLGRTPNPRRDANAACATKGLREFLIATTPDPRLVITIENPDSAAATQNYIKQAADGEKWHFVFNIGDDVTLGATRFSNSSPWGSKLYYAQIAEAPSFGELEAGQRSLSVNLLLAGVSNRHLRITAGH